MLENAERKKMHIDDFRRYKRKLQKVNIFFIYVYIEKKFAVNCSFFALSLFANVHFVERESFASTLNLNFYNLPNILSLNGIFGFLKKCKCFHFTKKNFGMSKTYLVMMILIR